MALKNIDGRTKFDDPPATGRFWNAVSVASAVSYYFPVFEGDQLAIQVDWTGDTTGATKVELSLNHRQAPDGTVLNAGTWTDITANAVSKYPFVTKYGSDPAGATGGPVLICIQQTPVGIVKFTYTPSGGSGTRTMTGYFEKKGI